MNVYVWEIGSKSCPLTGFGISFNYWKFSIDVGICV